MRRLQQDLCCGIINLDGRVFFVTLTAIDPKPELEISTFKNSVVKGEWLDDNIKGILIGKNMAESLGIDINSDKLGQKLC